MAVVNPEGWCVGELLTDQALARAITELRDQVAALVGDPARGEGLPVRGADESVAVLADCADRLVVALSGTPRMRRAAAALLQTHTALSRGLAGHQHAERQRRSDRLRAAVSRIRGVRGEADIFAVALDELSGNGFDRIMLTRVEDGVGFPERYHLERDPTWATEILEVGQAHPMQLSELVLETQMVRRRHPVIVTDVDVNPVVHRPLADITGCLSYVAAPITFDRRVVAFFHADAHLHRRLVDVGDRDFMWACAEATGAALERGDLRRRIDRMRADALRAASVVSALSDEPAEAVWHAERDTPPAPTHPTTTLSARETEVIALMAAGATNGAIAQALVLSPATIKTHVANILRKLGASNRAEAVARFGALQQRHEAP